MRTRIRSSAERLLHVFERMLDLSEIASQKVSLKIVEFSPEDLVQQLIASHQPQIQERQVLLRLNAVGSIPHRISTDLGRLRQILSAIFSNAVKFSGRGQEVRVSLFTDPSRRHLIFEFRDFGIGMDDELLGRLFEPFEQGNNSLTREHGGAGTDLCVAKQLAVLLGGDIEVESKIGEGSTFRLLLPLAESVVLKPVPAVRSDLFITNSLLPTKAIVLTPASATKEPPVAKPVGQGRILLVEDSLDLQKLMAYRLRTAGYDVTTAANGRIGVELALQQPFDVILTDIQMPEMDGETATRELRKQGYTGPIVGLSAHAMKGEREKNLANGMNEYLTKPVDTDVLVATLQRFIQAARTAASVAAPTTLAVEAEDEFTIMRREFLQGVPDQVASMRAALAAGERESLARQAHQLKGTAASYEVTSLSETAALLEDACQEGQPADLLVELVQDLQQEADRLAGKAAGNSRSAG